MIVNLTHNHKTLTNSILNYLTKYWKQVLLKGYFNY